MHLRCGGHMLFKYVGETDGEKALQILKYFCEDCTFKASDPTTFNDPFEFKIAIDFEADEDTVRQRFFLDNQDASTSQYEEWFRTLRGPSTRWWVVQETRRKL